MGNKKFDYSEKREENIIHFSKILKNYPKYYEQVRKFREENGLTQAELAELIGMTWRSIPNIESGRINPKISTLEKIAKVLGTELHIILMPHGMEKEKSFTNQSGKVSLNEQIADHNERSEKIMEPHPRQDDIFFFD